VYKYVNRYIQWSYLQTLQVVGAYEFGFSMVIVGNIAVISAPRTGTCDNNDNVDDNK
jgi:hypothetical protein